MFFPNFTPNKMVTFDDGDPPWMTEFIKLKYSNTVVFLKTSIKKILRAWIMEFCRVKLKMLLVLYLKERVTTTIS